MHPLSIVIALPSLFLTKLAAAVTLVVGLAAIKVLDVYHGGTDGEREHWD